MYETTSALHEPGTSPPWLWAQICVFADAELAAQRACDHYVLSGVGSEAGVTLLAGAIADGPTPVPTAIARIQMLLEETSTPVWRSFVLPLLARLEAMAGEIHTARAHIDEARLGRREFADQSTLATSWARLAGEVELRAADPARAEAILSKACGALRDLTDVEWLATNLAWLAQALYQQRRFEEASKLAAEAWEIAPSGDLIARNLARRTQARALAKLGRASEAEELAREALELIGSTDNIGERGRTLADVAEVLRAAGRGREATQTRVMALSLLEAKGDVQAAERVRSALLTGAG
jgi:tetratricopeptide (TPR) repeat protein